MEPFLAKSPSTLQFIYIKENRLSDTIYNSKTAEPIWLKISEKVA